MNKGENIFSNRSEFTWGNLVGPDGQYVIWIEDLLGMKSVTNDIENILADIYVELEHQGFQLKDFKIMYKDSRGIWDGIELNGKGAGFGHFFSLNETDQVAAQQKLLRIRSTEPVKNGSQLFTMNSHE